MDFFRELLAFIWAVVNSWAGYTTGGVIVAILWLWSILRPQAIPRKIAIGIAIFFLFCAFFHAWREQFRDASKTRARFDALTKPAFHIVISQITSTHHTVLNTTVVLVQMGVFNRGADSVLAGVKAHYRGPSLDADVDVVYLPPEEEARAFPNESLMEDRPVPLMRTVGTITRGSLVPGKLFITMPGNLSREIQQNPAALSITVLDYLGVETTGTMNNDDMAAALPFHQQANNAQSE